MKAHWNRGITLDTPQTRRWTQEQVDKNNRVEKTMVFENFSPLDAGRGRERICILNDCHPDYEKNASLITAVPAMYNALKKLMDTYEEKGQLLAFDVDIARQALKKAEGN